MLASVGLSGLEFRRLRHDYEDSDNLESLRDLSGRGRLSLVEEDCWRKQAGRHCRQTE